MPTTRFGKLTRLQSLMALLVLVAVVLSVLFGVLFATISRRDMVRAVQAEMAGDVRQVRGYMDAQMEDIQGIFSELIADSFLQKYASGMFAYDAYDLMDFTKRVQSMANRDGFINNIDVYVDRTGVLFTSDLGMTSHLDARTRAYLQGCMADCDTLVVTREYRQNLYYMLVRAHNQVSFLFPVGSQYGKQGVTVGLVAVSVQEGALIALMGGGDDRCRMLLDGEGTVFLSTDLARTGLPFEGTVAPGSVGVQQAYGQRQLAAFESVRYPGWTLAVLEPLSSVRGLGGSTGIYAVLLALLNVVLILAAEVLIVRYLSGRIRPLMDRMEHFQQGDFKVETGEQDEFSYLFDAFEAMRGRIGQQYNEIYHLSLLQKEANLKLMHAQIDPHFIYNIFNNMTWLLELKRYDRAADMVDAVAVYFKKSLNNGQAFITIRDEAALLRSYIDIAHLRFGDRFTADIQITEAIMDVRILNHLLQPLVENALYHGIDPLDRVGHLQVRGFVEGENLVFQVCDDGVGIEPEKLAQIRLALAQGQTDAGAFFALNNVHQRIGILYGEAYGLTVRSEQGKGTLVQVTLPAAMPDNGVSAAMERR